MAERNVAVISTRIAKRLMWTQKRAIVGVLALGLAGCASAKKDWERAQQVNTLDAYQEFVRKHSVSDFSREAQSKIEAMEWEQAEERNTIEAYQRFLSKHPLSEYSSEAKDRILKLEWERARHINTIEAYQNFARKYPQSGYCEEAKSKIEELSEIVAWNRISQNPDFQKYSEFIHKYPESKYLSQIDTTLITKFLQDQIIDLAGGDTKRVVRILKHPDFIVKNIHIASEEPIFFTSQVLRLFQSDELRAKGLLDIKGSFEISFSGDPYNIWKPGTNHILSGKLFLGEPVIQFFSDPTKPLRFVTENFVDYKWTGEGRGVVFIPPGRPADVTDYPYSNQKGTVYLLNFSS